MITVQNLNKNYGTVPVLKDITFEIKQGEIVGFLGPNGAGKTTLMRILTGYLPLTSGKATVAGFDVVKNILAVKGQIGYLPEHPPLYLNMTVDDYLKFAGQLKGISQKSLPQRVDHVLCECDLTDVRFQTIAHLSKGYKQRVGIAQAIIHDPAVLILDEPTDGLDPRQILQVRRLIKNLETKRTVILSTHILSEIEQIARRVIIINKGAIVADNSLDNLLTQASQPNAIRQERLEDVFLKLTD